MQTRELTIEGITFKIAPTPLAKMADSRGIISGADPFSEAGVKALISAIFWGARRAKKECDASGAITLEWLEENIDVHNSKDVFDTFIELNGMKKVTPADAASGEARPESPNP